MSDRSRHLPRRSVLSVPGSSERFLAKAPGVAADMILIDLEDAVAPAEKAAARGRAAWAVRELDWGDKVVAVRINSWETPHILRDLIEVVVSAGPRLDEVMLPKAQSAAEVVAVDLVLRQLEIEAGLDIGHLGIEAQIESAVALRDVEAICSSSPRLEAVVLGPADLAASLGVPALTGGAPLPGYPGDHFHGVLLAILVAARANGIQAIDGPYLHLEDAAGLAEMATRTASIGFDGKWAIHPSQVPVLNEIFSPSGEQFARALEIITALDEAAAGEGKGALRHGAEMLDEASRKMAEQVVARGRRAGLAG